MHHPHRAGPLARLLIIAGLGLVVVACAGAARSGSSDPATGAPDLGPSGPAPESSGGPAKGDIPDSAVFLTFRGGTPPFTIQYVEGWQVTPQAAGIVIRDKDSSETVATTTLPADVAAWVATTDIPALQAQAGFRLVKQDRVTVGGSTYDHLVYHLPAAPDPVTGKQVSSTIDRFYVPGPARLAVVSLSTPDGVDNVDAFRQMIGSFTWQ